MATRTMEDVKVEAIKRLEALNVLPNVIKDFKEGVINESERCGILYWLNDQEKEMVKKFEEEHEGIVYHVIHQQTNIGELYNLLYVNVEDEEWEMDADDLREGRVLAYVINKTYPDNSEFGSIGVKGATGGVVRTW